MSNLDLRLIRVFDEILRTGSLTEAAHVLGVSPPAISISLSRLRRLFNDALFVRTGDGMRPTPHASQLAPVLREAMSAMQTALGEHVVFDPATSTRTFRISMTDIGHLVMLPKLLSEVRHVAPHVALETVGPGVQLSEQMQKGEVDLAIGFIPQLEAGFFQQGLFSDKFVCVARTGHLQLASGLTEDAFAAAEHLVVSTSGTGHYIIDRTLEAAKVNRRVALRIYNFLGVAPIVEQSDLLCVLPERAGRLMCANSRLTMYGLPFAVTPYVVKQHWHESQSRDPGNQWLRRLVAQLFTSDGGTREA